MSTVWKPDPGEPLLDVQEDERGVSATVRALPGETGTPPTLLTWSTDEPLPPQVTVTVSGTTLHLSAPDLLGLFPVKKLRYLKPGDGMQYGEAKNWGELPEGAEIVEYRPFPSGRKTVLLRVRTDTGDTAVYEIVVRANFNTGRDSLRRAV